MKKLIPLHLRRRLANYIAVCVELIILLLVCNILLSQLIPFIQSEQLYKELGLSDILCCTTTMDRGSLEKVSNQADATVLWCNYKGQYTYDETVFIQPVEMNYFHRFYQNSADKIGNEPIAVVSESVSSKYSIGETYTVSISENIGEITFTVVGIADNDLMFIPPYGDTTLSIIGDYPHTIILGLNEDDLLRFHASDIYTLAANDGDAPRVADDLLWEEQIVTAMSCEDAQSYNDSLEMSQMGMPIVISITAIVLCLAGMLSNTLLTIIANERNNSIYYICGLTWKKCALIQIVCDLFVVILSTALALIGLLISSRITNYINLQPKPFLISFVIAITVYLITEVLGVLQFRKNNVIEIVGRVK